MSELIVTTGSIIRQGRGAVVSPMNRTAWHFLGSGFCEIKYHLWSGQSVCSPLPPKLSKLMWSCRSPSDPCEIMYHARKAAAVRSISTLTSRGEGGGRYHTNAFPYGTLFRRNRNKKKQPQGVLNTDGTEQRDRKRNKEVFQLVSLSSPAFLISRERYKYVYINI